MLLACRGGVEFAAHLGEALIDVLSQIDEVLPQIDEVLSQGVETCRRSLAEFAEVAADFADIAVGGSGEHTSRRGVLLTGLYSPGQVAHLVFESGDARFEIRRIHDLKRTGIRRYLVAPHPQTADNLVRQHCRHRWRPRPPGPVCSI